MEITIEKPQDAVSFSAGLAFWNSRRLLAENTTRIRSLHRAVDRPTDLTLFQWSQIIAATLEFKPDLIIELGRGKGNSTCAFAEALHMLKIPASIESLCFSDDWDRETLKKIQPLVSGEWFKPLHIIQGDILAQDFNAMTRNKKRILLFWDAHGFDVAECVLGKILPLIASQSHLVIMHDLSDARYSHDTKSFYGSNGLWKGNNWEGPRLRLGHVYSAVEQSISAIDFTSRNKITLHSADEDIRTEIGDFAERTEEMKSLLNDLFSLSAHWFHFSLNERSGIFTFPKFPELLSHQEYPPAADTLSASDSPRLNSSKFLRLLHPGRVKSRLKSIFVSAKSCLRALVHGRRSGS